MENKKEHYNQTYTWTKAAEHYSLKATLAKLNSNKWKKIADDLAFALDLVADDPTNIKSWFKAQKALERYEKESLEL